ncbi:hypothetical protein EI94DRAFT_1702133 [Lactarius quietus]|nr:hypothetical protein EI94DRAFT_1702133 [Lactarius quietus]
MVHCLLSLFYSLVGLTLATLFLVILGGEKLGVLTIHLSLQGWVEICESNEDMLTRVILKPEMWTHGSRTPNLKTEMGALGWKKYSIYLLFFTLFTATISPDSHMPPFVSFDTSVILIMFLLLDHYWDDSVKGKTSMALTDLIMPEKKISIELLEIGDTIKFIPGDKVLADRTVVWGTSSLNRNMITGEPQTSWQFYYQWDTQWLGMFNLVVTQAEKDMALAQDVKAH